MMYGYELVKAIRSSTGSAIGLREGVVYPALYAMEARGTLKARRKTVNGRNRVYYCVTAKGKRRLMSSQKNGNGLPAASVPRSRNPAVPRRQDLLRRLYDAGITPRCLLRLDAELQDHYVDLEREALGAVKDVVVIESTDSLFEHAAIEAAYKFKYRPRIIRGESIEVPGVRNKITFDIAV
jgi:DNA-binding PadR family transcriptional regulator